MEKNLIIIPNMYRTTLRMKGLSVRKVHDLCKDESGYYRPNYNSDIEGRTAVVKREVLINFLVELFEETPFDKITIKGRYEVSGEDLMEEVKKKINALL